MNQSSVDGKHKTKQTKTKKKHITKSVSIKLVVCHYKNWIFMRNVIYNMSIGSNRLENYNSKQWILPTPIITNTNFCHSHTLCSIYETRAYCHLLVFWYQNIFMELCQRLVEILVHSLWWTDTVLRKKKSHSLIDKHDAMHYMSLFSFRARARSPNSFVFVWRTNKINSIIVVRVGTLLWKYLLKQAQQKWRAENFIETQKNLREIFMNRKIY